MGDFGDYVFAGTAGYYAKYRAPYPTGLFKDIVRAFNLNDSGRLLDLGCGTGELAIPLSNWFEKVIAVDPDEDMLVEAERKAKAYNASNIDWVIGSSRNLTGVKGDFRLVAMGQSFHWMDGEKVLKELYPRLEPSGGIVIVGSVQTTQNSLSTDKDEFINALITRYLGPKRRAGSRFYQPSGGDWEREVFPSSEFKSFERLDYEFEFNRNVNQVVGNLFSMSYSSKKLLGRKARAFEDELRQGLGRISGGKKFVDRVHFNAYFLYK